ncbi:N-6 DNA methylase [Sinobacterium caligoides]|uniref:site-specific DNA-methyltransferase (adenine-specific) n=1 Tax=Sinobacterium caligoides TaxID=933926 RepID=A0A3N2E129_9GAMM|nr:N-6 DNA methylase [Sinobacterium caligoides]ROS05737.1 N-6 DNA methylase [Sinobacterium caligoides]
MKRLAKHNQSIRSIFGSLDAELLQSAVDLDSIDDILRDCLSKEEMREAGSYFTGQLLATKLVNSFLAPITLNSIVLDPACGAGNLLIECSRKLGVKSKLSKTLLSWGKVLHGTDIHHHFIESAKLRIIIEAINRGVEIDCNLEEALLSLPNIKVGDALSVTEKELSQVTHIIMNPPFTTWPSPLENYWGKGKINAAGIIFDKYIRLLPKDSNIAAILPDVLRSGSSYHKFRSYVTTRIIASCDIWGAFNSKTDVDVFILSGYFGAKHKNKIEWHKPLNNYTPLSDLYDVNTGSLVAYRAPEEGPLHPYFDLKNSPAGKTVYKETKYRRFKGKVFKPPFVLVKRTSSPSNKNRASATIVNIEHPAAVENHMVVITPKSLKVEDCVSLLRVLCSEKTNDFLNDRARMRHLTIGVIKDIPID